MNIKDKYRLWSPYLGNAIQLFSRTKSITKVRFLELIFMQIFEKLLIKTLYTLLDILKMRNNIILSHVTC